MRHLASALIFCAAPAAVLAQEVRCRNCSHVVPYFKGEGGFIAAVAGGADAVTFYASCGSIMTSGEEAPDADGIVSMLFNRGNGLACDLDDGGTFELGPVIDGGWYWITDARNTAVGSLLDKDVVGSPTVEPTDAGPGVEMTDGRGVVFIKETSTGRVGILPTILPAAPPPVLRKCGFSGAGTAASPFRRVATDCELGDGGTILLATATNSLNGTSRRVVDRGAVVRPPEGATGTVILTVDLWGNGTGHFVSDSTATGTGVLLGQPAVANTDARAAARLTGVTYTVNRGSGPTAVEIADGSTFGGVSVASGANLTTVTVAAEAAYCGANADHSLAISVSAAVASATDAAQVTPVLDLGAGGAAGETSFTIVCP
ncbi:MAG: hypothetical protein OXG74_16005 [Acidobacteria bacterium]|nr:hypothetical protein [Acidobacteriota bacterium]